MIETPLISNEAQRSQKRATPYFIFFLLLLVGSYLALEWKEDAQVEDLEFDFEEEEVGRSAFAWLAMTGCQLYNKVSRNYYHAGKEVAFTFKAAATNEQVNGLLNGVVDALSESRMVKGKEVLIPACRVLLKSKNDKVVIFQIYGRTSGWTSKWPTSLNDWKPTFEFDSIDVVDANFLRIGTDTGFIPWVDTPTLTQFVQETFPIGQRDVTAEVHTQIINNMASGSAFPHDRYFENVGALKNGILGDIQSAATLAQDRIDAVAMLATPEVKGAIDHVLITLRTFFTDAFPLLNSHPSFNNPNGREALMYSNLIQQFIMRKTLKAYINEHQAGGDNALAVPLTFDFILCATRIFKKATEDNNTKGIPQQLLGELEYWQTFFQQMLHEEQVEPRTHVIQPGGQAGMKHMSDDYQYELRNPNEATSWTRGARSHNYPVEAGPSATTGTSLAMLRYVNDFYRRNQQDPPFSFSDFFHFAQAAWSYWQSQAIHCVNMVHTRWETMDVMYHNAWLEGGLDSDYRPTQLETYEKAQEMFDYMQEGRKKFKKQDSVDPLVTERQLTPDSVLDPPGIDSQLLVETSPKQKGPSGKQAKKSKQSASAGEVDDMRSSSS